MKRITFAAWTIPVFFLGLCLLAFGAMAPKLGLYWDDWFIDWYIHFLKPQIFIKAFVQDRPLLGWMVALTTSLVGESPLRWQFFAIFMRWMCTLSLWWMLKGIWPRRVLEITAVSLLFAVYPGFSQQYISISYSHHLIVLAMTFVSLGAMIWGLRHARWFLPLYSISVIFSGFAMFTMEYFFGLELLRPVFLWLLLSESNSNLYQRIRRVVFLWFPYIIMMVFFLGWRISTDTPRARITFLEELSFEPVVTLMRLGRTILQDLFTATVLAWKRTLDITDLISYDTTAILLYGLIFVGIVTVTITYLSRLRSGSLDEKDGSSKAKRYWAVQAILMGLLSLVISGIPFWMTNLKVSLSFPEDRFTLPMMLGASLLLVGLIEILPIRFWQTITLIAVLAGLASGFQFHNALSFRKAWLMQRDFFWQLAWRAPAIRPNTILLTEGMSFPYNRDDSLSAPLNWIYSPGSSSLRMDYIFYDVETRMQSGLPDLHKNLEIKGEYRLSFFDGSMSQAIFFLYSPPDCVKVIDPLTDQYIPDRPANFEILIPLSKPSLIIPEGSPSAQPPPDIFGPEPDHNWCYYFEKAELARQLGDWQRIVELGNEALVDEIQPSKGNVAELMPFIEGYARTGNYEKAVQLSMKVFRISKNSSNMLCDSWDRIHQEKSIDSTGQEAIETILQTLNCVVH